VTIYIYIYKEYHIYASGIGAHQLRWLMRLDAALVRVLIGCMFDRVVTELETYHIYETDLQTIKVAACNLLGASNFTV
jgi:hypothetical protein